MGARDLGDVTWRLDAGGDRRPAVRRVEERERVGAEAERRDAERLERLRGRGHVEDRLRARGDHDDARSRELAEVGGDVRPLRPAAMDSADPAGAHEAEPDRARDRERAADGRRPDRTLRDRGGDVARPELARGRPEALELLLIEADAHLSVEHSDRRGGRTRFAHTTLALEPDRDTLAGRKAVRDQRCLERDDRPPFVECGAHLVREPHHGIVPSVATQRAAAARPRSGPAIR